MGTWLWHVVQPASDSNPTKIGAKGQFMGPID
jgi:hypothetical protein